jgi:hypothetical protein
MELIEIWVKRGRRVTTCNHCRRKVEWATDRATGRSLLFEGEIVALKTGRDEATWELTEFVDRADLHDCPNGRGHSR